MAVRLPARHHRGLYALCAVELCERFAASLFGSLLLLYLSERLRLSLSSATRWGGSWSAMVYLSSVIGGVIADRRLGTRRAILLGAGLLAAGYAVLSLDRASLLYPSAGLLVLGHALFKPSIHSAVGKLYEPTDRRREDAFSLFYVVFNIGAACGPLAGGFLRTVWGWSAAFAVAGLSMLLALTAGLATYRWLTWPAPQHAKEDAAPKQEAARSAWPVAALVGIVAAGLLFTAVYEQTGQSLLLWARDCTRRSLLGYSFPASSLLGLPGVLVLGIQPLLSRTVSTLTQRGCRPSLLGRIRLGLLFGVVAYVVMIGAALLQHRGQESVSPWWLVACFGALTVGELLVYPLSMALVTRLAPTTATAAAMGLWMAALAGGQWLAGEIAAHWATWSHATFFSVLSATALAAAVVLALATRSIRRALADHDHAEMLRRTPLV
jgi:POT family proton-dependent oligopeptide transporter